MVNSTRKGAIIQARTGSSRLPDKVLSPIPPGSEISMISQIVARAAAANSLDTIIVATSSEPEDDPIVEVLKGTKAEIFRGSEADILERYYLAAKEHDLGTIVRLTGDNPCIDPVFIEGTVRHHLNSSLDYSRSVELPVGTNVEVFSIDTLAKLNEKAKSTEERKDVTSYVQTHPEEFSLDELSFDGVPDILRECRFTVNYPSDYAFVSLLFEKLYPKNPLFGLDEIGALIREQDWLRHINRENRRFDPSCSFEEEIEEARERLLEWGYTRVAQALEIQEEESD